jgi:hypothetical protein
MRSIKLFENTNYTKETSEKVVNKMSNLKNFESYINEEEFIKRKDLQGSPYPNRNLPGLEVVYAMEFPADGTFGAIGNAQKVLNGMGYTIGSMEMDLPIGFANEEDFGYVSKWTRMTREEQKMIDGAIIPDPEFREGGVIVLFFKAPKFFY